MSITNAGAKYPEYKSQICAKGVFRSQTPRVYSYPKSSLVFRINKFPLFRLVRAKQGKTHYI